MFIPYSVFWQCFDMVIMREKWWTENIAKNTKTHLSADIYVKQEKTSPLPTGGTASSAPKVFTGTHGIVAMVGTE